MTETHSHGTPTISHRLRRMAGRDPDEHHRVATPLELLFDLTFVIAFGAAASQLAHMLAEGHYFAGITAFLIALWAVCWAWINYSWFSSAYDNDDWGFRLATMVVMVGVIVNALGIPELFKIFDSGDYRLAPVMVMGYIIMRLAMVFLWFRAARQDPARRATCMTYAITILLAQIGWSILTIVPLSFAVSAVLFLTLWLVEFASPVIAESKGGTPWHPHHIAERYGLLAIIALGEGVVGVVAAVSAVVQEQGWSPEAIMICAAGTALTFSMWWIYFLVPWGEVLHAHRERAFAWGYIHPLVFMAIAATGAGLDVAAMQIEHKAHIGPVATILSTAIPLTAFLLLVFALYAIVVEKLDKGHFIQIAVAIVMIAVSVAMAGMGFGMTACLAMIILGPASCILFYEALTAH